MKFFTTTLTSGSLTIDAIDGAMFVSIRNDETSGASLVGGSIPFKGINSTPVALGVGAGVNLSALSPQSPLDGITITWLGGSVDIVVGF
jgi:hypothetical protein